MTTGSPDHIPDPTAFPFPQITSYASGQELTPRQIRVLQLLGRLGLLEVEMIYALCYAGEWASDAAYDDLKRLDAYGYVWRGTAPSHRAAHAPVAASASRQRGGRRRHVYMLSDLGKDALLALGIEQDEATWSGLSARSRRGRPPELLTLGAELQAGWWCASLLEGLRRLPWCHGLIIRRDLADMGEAIGETVDALILARFNPARPRADDRRHPWMDWSRPQPYERDVLLALIVDRHWQPAPQLRTRLRRIGALQEACRLTFGRAALPVILCERAQRAAHYRAIFQRDDAPCTWGLIQTLASQRAEDLQYGALWASYHDLYSGASVPLLSAVGLSQRQRFLGYEPLLRRDDWERLLSLQAAGAAPGHLRELLAKRPEAAD